MNEKMRYAASFSGGKDSTAMVLKLIEDHRPLDQVVFFDTQMEFNATYKVVDLIEGICRDNGIDFLRVRDPEPIWLTMLARPVKDHYGYDWCGGSCRWGTAKKISLIEKAIGGGY